MHRQRWKQLGLYTIVSTIIGVALFYIYEPITLGFDWEDVFTLFLPSILGLTVLQYLIRSSFTKGYMFGHGLVGISWALTFPLLFHISVISLKKCIEEIIFINFVNASYIQVIEYTE